MTILQPNWRMNFASEATVVKLMIFYYCYEERQMARANYFEWVIRKVASGPGKQQR